jgi:tRNA(Ile2)-agmatinylcytidine synthase
MIFRSNQGTDAHLENETKIKDIKLYNPVIINGIVSSAPRIIKGGHVIFTIKDSSGQVDCSAYEPTVILSRIARKLIVGDNLTVYGGVQFIKKVNKLSINLEKIRINKLTPKLKLNNPICPKCDKRLKSMGKNQGFRCENCGFRFSKTKKSIIEIPRELKNGLYITAPRSQRHLTKPHSRYGKEKFFISKKMIQEWH